MLNIIFEIISIIGVLAAVSVYYSNSQEQKRQRVIENTERYYHLHKQAFSLDSYPVLNVAAMENGTFKRDSRKHSGRGASININFFQR